MPQIHVVDPIVDPVVDLVIDHAVAPVVGFLVDYLAGSLADPGSVWSPLLLTVCKTQSYSGFKVFRPFQLFHMFLCCSLMLKSFFPHRCTLSTTQ